MANKNQLGIFFGSSSLSIVETQGQKLVNFFDAPHSLFDDRQSPSSQQLPDDIKLTAIIQKSLRDKKIENAEVNFSLPSKDIILRSFTIPWVTSAELRGVVDFEARRYVPFRLEELVYNYHTATVSDKKVRRIRILFVAIRRETLERYCSILEQAGLKVVFIEPSSISLLRLLTLKKHIQQRQRIAIIQINQKEGAITIVDQGVPQFVRDFRLSSFGGDAFEVDPTSYNARLLNEIRISLDYYRRQHSAGEIEKLLLIAQNEPGNLLTETLGKDLSIAITALTTRAILNLTEEIDSGALNAFGIDLRASVKYPIQIDLTKGLIKPEAERAFEQTSVNYFTSIKLAITGAVILVIVFLFSTVKVAGYEKKLTDLTKRAGVYASIEINDLKKKQQDATEKLNAYKTVRLKSNVAFFLSQIPKKLPNGVWLTNFSVHIDDDKPAYRRESPKESPGGDSDKLKISIDLSGYSFTPDINQQIIQINQLIGNLRSDPGLSKIFEDVSLKTAKRDKISDNTVTAFQITCR